METRKAEIALEWADGEYLFALKAKQIEELQAVCKAGFGTIYKRVMDGNWYYEDIHNTIRLGLIGGGMGAVEAKRITTMYTEGVPLLHGPNSPLLVAQSIMGASIMGISTLPPGETRPETKMASSTSATTGRAS